MIRNFHKWLELACAMFVCILDSPNNSRYIHEDVNVKIIFVLKKKKIIKKIRMFCVYNMQGLQWSLMTLSEILSKCERNIILQLEKKYYIIFDKVYGGGGSICMM